MKNPIVTIISMPIITADKMSVISQPVAFSPFLRFFMSIMIDNMRRKRGTKTTEKIIIRQMFS